MEGRVQAGTQTEQLACLMMARRTRISPLKMRSAATLLQASHPVAANFTSCAAATLAMEQLQPILQSLSLTHTSTLQLLQGGPVLLTTLLTTVLVVTTVWWSTTSGHRCR